MIIIDIIISVTKIVFHFDLFNKNSRKSSPHSFLVLFLQHGYQITRKDRETIRDKCEYVVYKKLATLSRLSFTLYEQGRPDLIAELFNSVDSFIKSIYTIESLLSNTSVYFEYKTNVWLCIANNAITNYRDYWIFCEAALKKCGKWEEIYKISSFKAIYNAIDKEAL